MREEVLRRGSFFLERENHLALVDLNFKTFFAINLFYDSFLSLMKKREKKNIFIFIEDQKQIFIVDDE